MIAQLLKQQSRMHAFYSFLAIILWVFPARGAVWYVDNAAAGSNNGTSWANAWKSLATIAWSSSIQPGDTIYISGGSSSKTYNETLSVQRSGTSANNIVIQVGQTAGHDGKVIIDAQGVRSGCISLSGRSYIVISGDNGLGSTNLVLRNATSSDRFVGAAINGSVNNIKVDRVEVDNCNNGFNLNGGPGIIVQHCNLHGIRGDRAIGLSGADYYDSCTISNTTIQLNYSAAGYGPDGIQGGDGITVSGCHIYSATGSMANGQHMDGIQCIGNHWKIFNNKIHDMGNACIEPGTWGSSWNSIMIYNNVFAQTHPGAGVYEKGIDFTPNSAITAMRDIYIINNTWIDLTWRAIYFSYSPYNPSVSNFVIANNIIYDCGRNDTSYAVQIIGSTSASQSDYFFDYNLVNAGSGGTAVVSIDGALFTQTHPRMAVPKFVAYQVYSDLNDYHLASTDTAARDQGMNASAWIPSLDIDGVKRPQGAAWDIGAYELNTASGSTPVISVSTTALDFGSVSVGTVVDRTFTVKNAGGGILSGAASVASPFSVISGGTYSLSSNQSQVVTVRYSANSAGNYTEFLTLTGGGGAHVTFNGSAWAVLPGLSFESTEGTISQPFTVNGNVVLQPAETGLSGGGRAVYGFNITTSGDYTVSAQVNAPDDSRNSFFVNIDAEPTDPAGIWDISPLTSGLEIRIVSWRGIGTYDNPQFPVKVFTLAAGTHRLIIGGREGNVQLGRIAININATRPDPPLNLRIIEP